MCMNSLKNVVERIIKSKKYDAFVTISLYQMFSLQGTSLGHRQTCPRPISKIEYHTCFVAFEHSYP